ncbi:MBL fold metallo-hydrolase [Paenibacillus soyae]|uniref:MBL fold metallo-hydrolase n=1 Tax=Paenibacillus soyae TaxID=2969249 RepID=A0A9X2MPI0_9BACL|nr:MBL fold metallo-hydrolase [Paenibacillus soyae]MCR2803463.1 MBL fold metallo-hydrolase [Paenibacillus soyae]
MQEQLSYGEDYHYLPITSVDSGELHEVTDDVASLTVQVVNLCFVGRPGSEDWVLVDAGMPGSADRIIEEAERRYGEGSKPKGIVVTHGHFDHVGAIIELVRHWDVPVYVHELEMPYITGKQSYPEQDPSVDSGLVAKMSPFFPIQPIQLGRYAHPLPGDGTIPVMPGWQWIHTPGHTAGHISLFREADRFLIAGDAFVTVKQESLYKVITQEQEINGPPKYLTTDWDLAGQSVRRLQALRPRYAITGHGKPMQGPLLEDQLSILANEFEEIAVPRHGKYVRH